MDNFNVRKVFVIRTTCFSEILQRGNNSIFSPKKYFLTHLQAPYPTSNLKFMNIHRDSCMR